MTDDFWFTELEEHKYSLTLDIVLPYVAASEGLDTSTEEFNQLIKVLNPLE